MGDRLLDAIERGNLECVREELSSETVNYRTNNLGAPDNVGPPLYLASKKGHANIVALLLAHQDIDVNLPHCCGNLIHETPLSIAAEKGHTDIVKLLISRDDIDLNSKYEGYPRPLYYAISNRHVDIVKQLLPMVTNVNCSDGQNPLLIHAVREGHTDIVALLLARKDIQVNIQNFSSETPLIIAAEEGHNEIVELLVSRDDIDPNITDDSNWTPLSHAISEGHIQAVKLLLPKSSMDLIRFTSIGDKLLQRVVEKYNFWIIKLLILKDDIDLVSKGGKANRTFKRVMVGDGKVAMKPFLSPEKEYDWNFDGIYDEPITISIMNIKNRDILVKILARYDMLPLGQSLLSWAAENGYNALIRFLLIKERLDPNTKGDSGRTPLSQASENGHETAVRILLMDGRTNLNLNDDDSRTPISQAAEKGHELIVRLLLGKRATAISKTEMEWENEEERELFLTRDWANPNLKDNNGHTALSRAIENGHSAIVTLLAPIDTVTIFMMVQEGNRRAIKSLFDAKSNLDEQSGQGHTPLHAAILSGKLEIAKDLLSYGVRTNLQDSDNMTPLRLAMQQKDGRFIRELLKHKATMNGIMANEWRDSFDQEDEDIILFSEKENGEIHMDFVIALPTANEMSKQPSGISRSLYSFIETPHHSPWSKVPITGSTQQLRPNELYISIPKTASDMQSDISLSLWLSIENYLTSSSSTSSAANTYRIAWKMIRSTKPGSPWTSTVYFSTLPNGWMPENEMDLFKQFVFYVKGNWLRLCQQFETHLSKRRLEQLNCKGKTPDMIDLLANDALKLAELRSILHDQVRAAEKFINKYCRYFNANKIPQGLLEGLTEEFELVVNKRMGQLDQVIRDLLQIEFAWASINEARISTQLGQNVMLLTYVSIFYLPLGFCAALWAIPNITNSSTRTPFIATSIIVGLITLLITFNMERISGVVKRVIQYGKKMMVTNILGEGGQDQGQNEVGSRKDSPRARFGDSFMAFLKALARKKEQQKQNKSKV